jgi:hypothetical protein
VRRGEVLCMVLSACKSEDARTIIFLLWFTNWNGRRRKGKVQGIWNLELDDKGWHIIPQAHLK